MNCLPEPQLGYSQKLIVHSSAAILPNCLLCVRPSSYNVKLKVCVQRNGMCPGSVGQIKLLKQVGFVSGFSVPASSALFDMLANCFCLFNKLFPFCIVYLFSKHCLVVKQFPFCRNNGT